MARIKIDKKVPIAPRWSRSDVIYPFAELEVGDSFFAPSKKRSFSNLAVWSKKTGFKFMTRKTVENGQPGFRVWRTE